LARAGVTFLSSQTLRETAAVAHCSHFIFSKNLFVALSYWVTFAYSNRMGFQSLKYKYSI